MKIYNVPRQVGKSYKIAEMLKKDNNIIIVQPTVMSKDYFISRNNIPKQLHKNVITSHDLYYNCYDLIKGKHVIFDELSACLDIMFNNSLKISSYGTEHIVQDLNY